MKIDPQYHATILGGLFTVGSFLLTFTFMIPVFSIMPGTLIESMMASILGTEPYSSVGIATIIVLLILLVIWVLFCMAQSKKRVLQNGQIIGFMAILYFIIHPLGFYLYWAIALDFRNDGQLVFAAVDSFPVSSMGFLIFGVLIDGVKLKSPKEKQ